MSSLAISGAPGLEAAVTTLGTPANSGAPTPSSTDTVKLSDEAEARLMYQQGQGIQQIATLLDTTIATVDGYLNVTLPPQLATAQLSLSVTAAG